jgi:predicted amidohydrolase
VKLRAFRVGLAQTEPVFGEVGANIDRAFRGVERALARSGGADLVILPELFNTGYLFRSQSEIRSLAEDARRGTTAKRLTELAGDLRTKVVAGICELHRGEVYNTAVWVGARGVEGLYRKVHLFDREKLFFQRGNRPWPVFRVGSARIGVLICFDWRYPEAARALALAGADLLAHPVNLVQRPCQEAMRTRCLENRVFAATVNRVGEDRRGSLSLGFTGRSQMVAPDGRVLVRGGESRSWARVVTVDLAEAREKRVTGRNHLLNDRIPALYGALARVRGDSSSVSRPRR